MAPLPLPELALGRLNQQAAVEINPSGVAVSRFPTAAGFLSSDLGLPVGSETHFFLNAQTEDASSRAGSSAGRESCSAARFAVYAVLKRPGWSVGPYVCHTHPT
eukprot:scaffold1697_cov115-Isochrysis_galbana.AAC.2